MAEGHSMLPRTAEEAVLRGEPKFFTGIPCRNGHISPRYVKSRGSCVQCCDEQKQRRVDREPDLHKQAYLKRRESALEYGAAYRKKNAEVLRAKALAHARANKERHNASSRAWKAANKHRTAESAKAWKTANKDRWRQYASDYQKQNAAYFREAASRRKAAKLQATVPWSDMKAIAAIYAEAHRISVETGIPHHVDHIIPLQGETVCGLHVETNLRVIPAAENIAKSNRLIEV